MSFGDKRNLSWAIGEEEVGLLLHGTDVPAWLTHDRHSRFSKRPTTAV